MTDKARELAREPYYIEAEGRGCTNCGSGEVWAIVHHDGTQEVQESTSYGDKETAQDICELMNAAYSRGMADTERRKDQEAQALVAAAYQNAADEICACCDPEEIAEFVRKQALPDARAALDACVADRVKEAVSLERKNWLEEGWGKSVTQRIEEAVQKERAALIIARKLIADILHEARENFDLFEFVRFIDGAYAKELEDSGAAAIRGRR